jgi:hypothetical protein
VSLAARFSSRKGACSDTTVSRATRGSGECRGPLRLHCSEFAKRCLLTNPLQTRDRDTDGDGIFFLAIQKHGDEPALERAVLQAVNTPIDRFIRESICRLRNRVMSRTFAHPEPPYAASTMTTRANDARHRTLSDIDWRAVAASKPLPADLAVSPRSAPGAFFGFPLLYLQALIDGPRPRLFDIRIALRDLIASPC